MKFLPFLFIPILVISGCESNENNTQPADITKQPAEPAIKKPNISIVNDTLIKMQFDNVEDTTSGTAEQLLDGDKHLVCEVTITKADSIYAAVMPVNPPGNVRFTQMIMPDGKADGPFGQVLNYPANLPGTYKLIIGENMMAGDKWKGKIKLKVWVK